MKEERCKQIIIEVVNTKFEEIFKEPELEHKFEQLMAEAEIINYIKNELEDFKSTLSQVKGEAMFEKMKSFITPEFIEEEIRINLKAKIITNTVYDLICSNMKYSGIKLCSIEQAKELIHDTFVALKRAAITFKFN